MIKLDHAIAAADIPGVVEVIPALVNLLVIFDPLKTRHADVENAVRKLKPDTAATGGEAKTHTVGVCYEDGLTPDLEAVSKACDMSPEAVIEAHTSGTYRVCMYGFAPGYAYLSGVPKENAHRMVGDRRTAVQVMTGDPEKPFLFDMGDIVKFQRIGRETYEGQMP